MNGQIDLEVEIVINLDETKSSLIDVLQLLIGDRIIPSQYTEWILDEIAKATNKTLTGLKCMLQGFRMCFK